MSFSPTLSLVRLQELKQWQGSFEDLLQSKTKGQIQDVQKEFDHSAPFRSSDNLDKSALKKAEEWDTMKITPAKPFAQLLEEKLAEDHPIAVKDKPKKPFLRKGEGLARFRMASIKKTDPPKPKAGNTSRKGILKKTNPQYHREVDLSPLEVPDFVKTVGTWKQVFETADHQSPQGFGDFEKNESIENYEQFRRSLSSSERTHNANQNKSSSGQPQSSDPPVRWNDFPPSQRIYFEGQNPLISNDIPDSLSGLGFGKLVEHVGDLTLEDLRSERELKVFETLERKVDNSSFCSTNTSILNLLVSTPQKLKRSVGQNEAIAEDEPTGVNIVDDSVISKYIPDNIQEKLLEVTTKTNVLQQFLLNLYNMDSDTHILKKTASTNTSFSDENSRWSSKSSSVSSSCTELDSLDCQNVKCEKIDVAVNTSVNLSSSTLDETVKVCQGCEDLRSKYSEWKSKASELKSQASQLKLELKQLQSERDALKNEVKEAEYKVEKLENELVSERKKFLKDRNYFETYVKEAQKRPSKKEREEINGLKQELADVKEMVKLKDAKNGATQARLRTQIKQQDKELTELKITLEKLQKENAKLTASQKFIRRPQEVKMLHEINKNLTMLAEKTLKKQLNKSGHGDMEDGVCIETQTYDSKPDKCDKENKKSVTVAGRVSQRRSASPKLNKLTSADNNFDGLSVERQYETTFGCFDKEKNTSGSNNIEKSERHLPDGSVEITYSNGNLKNISADGKLIQMKYFNGDVRETDLNTQTIKYHYAAADSWHIQYPDGTEVMEFKDGHKCTKRTDGSTEVSYPDGTLKTINADGTEEQIFPDGRKTIKNLQGEHIILLPNGQKEIHTDEYKRREYPDGTTRTLHKDGTVETVYANGRVRLKDASGTLIMDTHQT